jgi:GDP-L-fucose synthase
VTDAVRAIVLATGAYDRPEPVNLGSGQEISIRDLAALIARLTGFAGTILWDTSKPNGQPRRCLDVTRAERQFGFRATTPLEKGLEETIRWYRASAAQQPRDDFFAV